MPLPRVPSSRVQRVVSHLSFQLHGCVGLSPSRIRTAALENQLSSFGSVPASLLQGRGLVSGQHPPGHVSALQILDPCSLWGLLKSGRPRPCAEAKTLPSTVSRGLQGPPTVSSLSELALRSRQLRAAKLLFYTCHLLCKLLQVAGKLRSVSLPALGELCAGFTVYPSATCWFSV